jgi:enoyl-CoA hydratase/carnithine racemase
LHSNSICRTDAGEISLGLKTIQLTERENVGTIILNRPEKRNTRNEAMGEELRDRIRYCGDNRNMRAMVLTGSRKVFFWGGDLLEIEPTKS